MSERLDSALVKRNLTVSRERAKELIKNGQIFINGKPCIKPSFSVGDSDIITVEGHTLKYVGRGGLKLEKAIKVFNIDLNGKLCMDIGASTGGFTDCMLQYGAKKVYAVDVGHGQLAEKLKSDNRVVNLEGINIRDFDLSLLVDPIDFISIDVSFISLKLVLPKAFEILNNSGSMSVLIKPQFETGRKGLGKNGIVKDKGLHIKILNDIIDFTKDAINVSGMDFSAVTGGDGNIEYLMYCSRILPNADINTLKIAENAFAELKGGKN